jgi:hypothetical protein
MTLHWKYKWANRNQQANANSWDTQCNQIRVRRLLCNQTIQIERFRWFSFGKPLMLLILVVIMRGHIYICTYIYIYIYIYICLSGRWHHFAFCLYTVVGYFLLTVHCRVLTPLKFIPEHRYHVEIISWCKYHFLLMMNKFHIFAGTGSG